jgi:hypothetical protein
MRCIYMHQINIRADVKLYANHGSFIPNRVSRRHQVRNLASISAFANSRSYADSRKGRTRFIAANRPMKINATKIMQDMTSIILRAMSEVYAMLSKIENNLC